MHQLGRRGTLRSLLNVEPGLAPSAIRASFEQPSGEEAEKRSARARPWQSYALVAALMVALGYGVYLTWRTWQTPAPVSNGAALTLRAERRGKMLRVSWNRDNPMVNHARDAVLSIRDGDLQPKELHLDREQLRNGTVVYSAAKDSVQFRLEVRGQDETKTSETILAGVAPKARLTARLIAAGRPAAGSSSRNRRSSRPGGAVLVDPPSPPASFHPQALAQIEQVVFAQPKLAVLPSQESEQSDMNPAFIGPRPIHQSLPNLPSEIRATVLSEVGVQVKVQVDEYGRVVKVDLVEATGPASNALVSATQQAARLWRFAPGARGSEPVASEVVLMFRYIPKTGGN